jgi:Domain of unknown function (DUF6438)
MILKAQLRRVSTGTGILCIALLCACKASARGQKEDFVPPSGILIVGFREAATHRPSPLAVPAASGQGMPTGVDLWLHIDSSGRVLGVRGGIDASPDRVEKLQVAARLLKYRPFMHDGTPVEAWVQDTLTLIARPKQPKRTVSFPEVTNPAKATIQLARSGCYGTCPSYVVTIRGDGEATYHGDGFVSFPGTHTAHIDPSAVASLLGKFRSANFLALDDEYRAGVTDNPTYSLSLNLDGKIKIVTDYVGAWVGMPPEVTVLEDAIDEVSDSARWVRSSRGTLGVMRELGVALNSPQATQIFLTAIDVGDLVTVRGLLAAKTPFNIADQPSSDSGRQFTRRLSASPLQLAICSRNEGTRSEMMRTLLASEPLRADEADMQRALGLAVEKGYVDIAGALIAAGADPNARFTGEYEDQEQKETYLMLASASGVWGMLDDALTRPHDIRAVDAGGRTALVKIAYDAPQHEDIFPLVDRLLAAGADRSELDRVLLDTCQPGWIPGLIARGANVNARDDKGDTPLFQSCTVEGVEALLEAGADPNLRNHEGKTAIQDTYSPDHGKEDPRAAAIRKFLQAKTAATSTTGR